MDLNFKTIRSVPKPGIPHSVLYQRIPDSPMEPRTVVMAYKEFVIVNPVVPDYNCFLLESRGVTYNRIWERKVFAPLMNHRDCPSS